MATVLSRRLACRSGTLGESQRCLSKLSDTYSKWVQSSEKSLAESRERLFADFKDHTSRFEEIGRSIRLQDMETGFPTELLPAHERFRVPSINGVQALDGTPRDFSAAGIFSGRTTLLGASTSAIGRSFVTKALGPLADELRESPHMQSLELSLVDNGALTWLVKPLLLASMRMQVPSEQQPGFLCCFGASREPREGLKIANRFAGYIFVIDRRGEVRWRASGHHATGVTEDDLQVLRKQLDAAHAA